MKVWWLFFCGQVGNGHLEWVECTWLTRGDALRELRFDLAALVCAPGSGPQTGLPWVLLAGMTHVASKPRINQPRGSDCDPISARNWPPSWNRGVPGVSLHSNLVIQPKAGQHWQLAFPGPTSNTYNFSGSFATTSSLECAMPSSGKARCPPLSGRMSSGAENRGCGIAHEPSAHVTPLAPDLPGCGTLRLTLGMRSSSQFCPAALTCPHPKESQPSSNFLLLVFSLVALLS